MLQPLLNTPDPRYLENYDRIVAFAPALRRASFRGVTGLLHHSTTIEFFSPFKLIEGIDSSLRLHYDAWKPRSAISHTWHNVSPSWPVHTLHMLFLRPVTLRTVTIFQ